MTPDQQAMRDFNLELMAAIRGVDIYGEDGDPVTTPVDVFRIEMPDGHGPFNSTIWPDRIRAYEYLTRDEAGWPGHMMSIDPAVGREAMGISDAKFSWKHGHIAYGCDSLEHLLTWFPPPSREYLAKHGGKIVRYTVPVGQQVLRMSAGQICFVKHTAIKVEEKPL